MRLEYNYFTGIINLNDNLRILYLHTLLLFWLSSYLINSCLNQYLDSRKEKLMFSCFLYNQITCNIWLPLKRAKYSKNPCVLMRTVPKNFKVLNYFKISPDKREGIQEYK